MGDTDLYNQEYNKCLDTGLYSSDTCTNFAGCVYEGVVGVSYGVPVLCGLNGCADKKPDWYVPFQEDSCYSALSNNAPITYPGIPIDTGDHDAPIITNPPTQVPPCDIFFDCKQSKQSSCLLL